MGFSFHAGPDLLDRLLTEHPEVEFVQLQLNYADWENKKITSRANYEVARKHGKKNSGDGTCQRRHIGAAAKGN